MATRFANDIRAFAVEKHASVPEMVGGYEYYAERDPKYGTVPVYFRRLCR